MAELRRKAPLRADVPLILARREFRHQPFAKNLDLGQAGFRFQIEEAVAGQSRAFVAQRQNEASGVQFPLQHHAAFQHQAKAIDCRIDRHEVAVEAGAAGGLVVAETLARTATQEREAAGGVWRTGE